MIFDELNGKVAIVTGGNRGVGEGIVDVLSGLGMRIMIAAPSDELNQKKVRDLSERGAIAIARSVDVTDENQVSAMVAQTLEVFGSIDVLVNNAGLDPRDKWYEITSKNWDRVQEVNVKGYYFCAKYAAAPMLKQNWGRIVNISSASVFTGNQDALHYITSKAANIGFTRSLAKELARTGVTVNCIAPGAVETPKEMQLGDPEYCRQAVKRIVDAQLVEGRLQPADIGWLTAYLCTSPARFITGQTLNIDGGRSFI
jgi:3-oxoacyl-[acyl-carrier protein] reductase